MPGALLDVFDVVESLGCDHDKRVRDEGTRDSKSTRPQTGRCENDRGQHVHLGNCPSAKRRFPTAGCKVLHVLMFASVWVGARRRALACRQAAALQEKIRSSINARCRWSRVARASRSITAQSARAAFRL